MKRNIFTAFFVALTLTLSLVACKDNSPKSSAEVFLNSFYHMEYAKARTVSTSDTKKVIDMIEQFAINYPDSTKKEAKNIKIEIIDVKEDGDNAVATYTTSNEPGEQKLNLVKQNGVWLANFSKLDNAPAIEEEEEEPAEETEETTEE